MENSPLIADASRLRALDIFIHGYQDPGRQTSARVAWALESAALHEGWLDGQYLGSESELIERFGVSRDVLREAVRMLEARGSMRMQRGCKGGLRLMTPSVDRAAAALVLYLRALGCTGAGIAETAGMADPVFDTFDHRNLIARLYRQAVAAFAANPTNPHAALRGPMIAIDLIQSSLPIPESCARLGSEAELCEKFGTCRKTLRQALKMLDDLGMLKIRRGRGGGYALQRPEPIGIVRQLFALLASRKQTLRDTVQAVWALNLVNLRLAMRQLQGWDPALRAERCSDILSSLSRAPEPMRWAMLQGSIAAIAGSALVSTLQHCIVAYQARLGRPAAAYDQIDSELLAIEQSLVYALCNGADVEAEQLQRIGQRHLAQLLECGNLMLC